MILGIPQLRNSKKAPGIMIDIYIYIYAIDYLGLKCITFELFQNSSQ